MSGNVKVKNAISSLHADDLIFYASYSLWLVVSILSLTTFFGVYVTKAMWNVICWICLAALLVSEILYFRRRRSCSWNSVVGFIVLAVVAVCCFRCGRNTTMWSIPFIFCARNRDIRLLFKISLVLMTITMAFVMLAAYQGVIKNVVANASGKSAGRVRHYLGFRYPLRPAMISLAITGMALFLLGKKLDKYSAALLILLNVAMFCLTGSRLSCWLAIAAVVICFALVHLPEKPGKQRSRAVACAVSSCFVLAAVVAVLLSVFYDPSVGWMVKLDGLLEHRMRLTHDVIAKYGTTVFGQKVSMVGNSLSLSGQRSTKEYFYADSIYAQQVVMYGLFVLAAYVCAMSAACYRGFMRGDRVMVLLLVLVSVHGMLDNLTFDLWLDPLLFFSSELMGDRPEGLGGVSEGASQCVSSSA